MDDLSLIESRISKLESFVGKFDKIDETKGLDTITNISNKITNYVTNSPKIILSMKNINDIKKYINLESLNEVEEEALINSKIDFILSEEHYLRNLSENFNKLNELVKILDNKSLNDVPHLTDKLKDISAKQASVKVNQANFITELKDFLTVYSSSITSINETITCLNEYLDQFDKPLPPKENSDN